MRSLLAPLVFSASALLAAEPGPRSPAAPSESSAQVPIEWVAPTARTVAVAGGRLEIAWRARPGEEADFEEWEAFLSLDNGGRWPYRLTPHLDRGVERFVVDLPPIASEHARLMIRYGDEREERELEAPFELAIAPARGPIFPGTARPVARRGESARKGDEGVVAWVDGPRSGSPLVRYEWSGRAWMHPGAALDQGSTAQLALLESGPEPPPTPVESGTVEPHVSHQGLEALRTPPAETPSASERLARLGRRNE